LDAMGAAHGGDVTVVADARRREVYWATYAGGRRTAGPGVASPADVPIAGTVVGRAAVMYPEAFADAAHVDPEPEWLARVVARQRAEGQTEFPTEPLYLRR